MSERSDEEYAIDSGIISKTAYVMVTPTADLTQVITVVAAGTPVQGPNVDNPNGWVLKAGADNTDTVYFMFYGQTKTAKGFPLNAGEAIILPVRNLSSLGFDADVSGEKVCAAKL